MLQENETYKLCTCTLALPYNIMLSCFFMILLFPRADVDECKEENKMGCSEACVNSPGGFSCLYLSTEGVAQGRRET